LSERTSALEKEMERKDAQLSKLTKVEATNKELRMLVEQMQLKLRRQQAKKAPPLETWHKMVLWVCPDDTSGSSGIAEEYLKAAMTHGVTPLKMSSSKMAIEYLTSPNCAGPKVRKHNDHALRVVTCMARKSSECAGVELAEQLRTKGVDIPIMIFEEGKKGWTGNAKALIDVAYRMTKEKRLMNVLSTTDAEKLLDFAFFQDTHLAVSSRQDNAGGATKQTTKIRTRPASKDPLASDNRVQGCLQRLHDMGLTDRTLNLTHVKEHLKKYPHCSLEDLVAAVACKLTH